MRELLIAGNENLLAQIILKIVHRDSDHHTAIHSDNLDVKPCPVFHRGHRAAHHLHGDETMMVLRIGRERREQNRSQK